MQKNSTSIIERLIIKLKNLFSKSKKIGSEMHGIIKFFDKKKGFGFIVSSVDKKDYFFNTAAIKPNNFKLLKDGVAVKFTVTKGKKGLQAKNIRVD